MFKKVSGFRPFATAPALPGVPATLHDRVGTTEQPTKGEVEAQIKKREKKNVLNVDYVYMVRYKADHI